MPQEKDPNELGALWVRTSQKGVEYMSGSINGVDVVCFRTRDGGGKRPDWRVMKSQPKGAAKPQTAAPETKPAAGVEDDIPF